MTKLAKETVNYLNHCKDAFLGDVHLEEFKSQGRVEVEDLLDGIFHKDQRCYVSYLFKQLSNADKTHIKRALDFHIDFDNLTAYYTI